MALARVNMYVENIIFQTTNWESRGRVTSKVFEAFFFFLFPPLNLPPPLESCFFLIQCTDAQSPCSSARRQSSQALRPVEFRPWQRPPPPFSGRKIDGTEE